jgi:hypothetical protein
VAHVDLTVAMIILALPIVVLALLRVAESIAQPIVARRSAALVRAIERARQQAEGAERSDPAGMTNESRLTDQDDEVQG